MFHPIREWHSDPMAAGIFYGFVLEAFAIISLIPAGYPTEPGWALVLAAVLAVLGMTVSFVGLYLFNRGDHE